MGCFEAKMSAFYWSVTAGWMIAVFSQGGCNDLFCPTHGDTGPLITRVTISSTLYSNPVSLDNTSAPLNTLPFHTSLHNTWVAQLLAVCFACISCTWCMYIVFFYPSWANTLSSASFCCCWPQPRIMKRWKDEEFYQHISLSLSLSQTNTHTHKHSLTLCLLLSHTHTDTHTHTHTQNN